MTSLDFLGGFIMGTELGRDDLDHLTPEKQLIRQKMASAVGLWRAPLRCCQTCRWWPANTANAKDHLTEGGINLNKCVFSPPGLPAQQGADGGGRGGGAISCRRQTKEEEQKDVRPDGRRQVLAETQGQVSPCGGKVQFCGWFAINLHSANSKYLIHPVQLQKEQRRES